MIPLPFSYVKRHGRNQELGNIAMSFLRARHSGFLGRNTVKLGPPTLHALSMLSIDEHPLNAFVTKAGAPFCNAALTYRWTSHRGPPHGDGHAPEGEEVSGLAFAIEA